MATNGLFVLERLAGLDASHQVICAGGGLRSFSRTLGGAFMESALREFRFVAAIRFIAATSMTLTDVGCNHEWDMCAKRAIRDSCRVACVVADSSKIKAGATFNVLSLNRSQVDFVLTDRGIFTKDNDENGDTGNREDDEVTKEEFLASMRKLGIGVIYKKP